MRARLRSFGERPKRAVRQRHDIVCPRPLLLVLQNAGVGFGDALDTQDIAEPIVATLVGAIGLIAAVPLTTGLAAMLAARVPAAALPEHAHAEHHH
jgi:hypothetical protein